LHNLGVILAKKHSTRLPNKNFLEFNGQPIIEHSINEADKFGLFDKIIVSTDMEKDEYYSITEGVLSNVTVYKRKPENTKENSTMYDALMEVLEAYPGYDNVCLIHACNPLLKAEYIRSALLVLSWENYDTVIPACNIGGYIMHATNDKIQLIDNANYTTNTQSQKVQYYQNVGMFYWCKIDKLYENKSVLCENMGFIELSKMQCQDIDDAGDWEIAKWKYKRMNEK